MNTSPFLNSSYLSSKSCYYHIHQLCCIRSYLGLYRSNHSTETAVLKVLSDILLALDSGKLALLSLLDLSAAFDSFDHDTLLQRLQTSYSLGGNVIAWFASYLTGRCVRIATSRSISLAVLFGVPQGSVLGPILFLFYVADLLQLVKRHGLHPHCYADDTQIYGFCDPSDVDALQERVVVKAVKGSWQV